MALVYRVGGVLGSGADRGRCEQDHEQTGGEDSGSGDEGGGVVGVSVHRD